MNHLTEDPSALINIITGTTPTNGIIGSARKSLIQPTLRDHETARKFGFVNAEHEVLAWLGSEWYFELMEAALAIRPYVPGQYTVLDAGQAILDQAYGGQIRMNTKQEVKRAPDPLLRRGRKYPDGRDYDYSVAKKTGHKTVLSVLRAYDEIIIFERAERKRQRAGSDQRQLVLDLEFLVPRQTAVAIRA